jgi:hypothetical protein
MKRSLTGMAAAVLLLAATACDAPTMPGHGLSDVYDFRLQTTPRSVLRWPLGTTVRVYVAGGTGERAALLEGSMDRAARVWNQHALYGEYRLARTNDITQADAVLRWSDDASPVDTQECEPVLGRAVTTFCLTDNGPPAGTRLRTFPLLPPHAQATSRVRMLVTILGTQAQLPERLDGLVAHEMGHVLGIGQHSLDARDLMHAEPGRTDPSQRDAASVRVMYHTRADITP